MKHLTLPNIIQYSPAGTKQCCVHTLFPVRYIIVHFAPFRPVRRHFETSVVRGYEYAVDCFGANRKLEHTGTWCPLWCWPCARTLAPSGVDS